MPRKKSSTASRRVREKVKSSQSLQAAQKYAKENLRNLEKLQIAVNARARQKLSGVNVRALQNLSPSDLRAMQRALTPLMEGLNKSNRNGQGSRGAAGVSRGAAGASRGAVDWFRRASEVASVWDVLMATAAFI